MDINPLTPGHLLVVTVEHYPDLASVPPATAAAVMQTAQDCAEALRSSPLAPDGINLLYADGAAAGQEVFHSHLHVVPRFTGDGFGIRAARPPIPSRTDLDALAAEIGAHLR